MKRKILLCEDNEMVTDITRFALESEGFEVEAAMTTGEALSKVGVALPDLVLLDLNLPEHGGASFLKILRSGRDTNRIPVILFSAERNLPKISAELQADAYILKPFEMPDLIETVQKLLRTQGPE